MKKKGLRKPLPHKMTQDVVKKRTKRFSKTLKNLMWLDPVTAPLMAAKVFQQKRLERNRRRRNGKANPQVEAILQSLQNQLQGQAAPDYKPMITPYMPIPPQMQMQGKAANLGLIGKSALDFSQTAPAPVQQASLSQLAAQVAAVPTVSIADPSGVKTTAQVLSLVESAEGDASNPMNYDKVFAEAKAKANALTDPAAKAEALDAINEAELAVKQSAGQARIEVSKADPKDIAQAKDEMAGVDKKTLADSVANEDANPEKTESATAAEKNAIANPTTDKELAKLDGNAGGGIPVWGYVAGTVVLGVAAWYGYQWYKSKKN